MVSVENGAEGAGCLCSPDPASTFVLSSGIRGISVWLRFLQWQEKARTNQLALVLSSAQAAARLTLGLGNCACSRTRGTISAFLDCLRSPPEVQPLQPEPLARFLTLISPNMLKMTQLWRILASQMLPESRFMVGRCSPRLSEVTFPRLIPVTIWEEMSCWGEVSALCPSSSCKCRRLRSKMRFSSSSQMIWRRIN